MKNKSRIGFVLYIDTNSEHPSLVSKKTGINATTLIILGEPYISLFTNKVIESKQNDCNLWIYKSKKIEVSSDECIIDLFNDVIRMLEKKKNEFIELFSTYNSSYLQFYMYTDDFHVYLHLPHGLMSRLYEYGIDIVFDIYSLYEAIDES